MWLMITGVFEKNEDAITASFWANALGLVVTTQDPRSVLIARDITQQLRYDTVLVTHDTKARDIKILLTSIQSRTIQLVEDIPLEEIMKIKSEFPMVRIIKSVYIKNHTKIDEVRTYHGIADAIELDSSTQKQQGGTGKTHNWKISRRIVQESQGEIPIILAGGLNTTNLLKAIEYVQPNGVDISTGVKTNQVLDNKKLREIRTLCTQIREGKKDPLEEERKLLFFTEARKDYLKKQGY